MPPSTACVPPDWRLLLPRDGRGYCYEPGSRARIGSTAKEASLGKHVMARSGSPRATTSQLAARRCEPRAITNLIEYIDLYEVPYGLRVQLMLSSY